MIEYTFWQRIFRAILLGVSIGTVLLVTAEGNDRLPNDCAIIGTEAYGHLKDSAVWSQVMKINFIDVKTGKVHGHILTVWQIHKDGIIFVYDDDGALDLNIHSQKPFDIAAELNRLNPAQPIFEAKFLQ